VVKDMVKPYMGSTMNVRTVNGRFVESAVIGDALPHLKIFEPLVIDQLE